MTAAPAIHGIIAYPITPFDRDGGVDTEALTTLLEKLIGAGVHAIAPLGSTGEAAYLTEDEFDSVVDTTVNIVGKAGLNLLGAGVGDPRPPLLPLDEAGLDEMRSLLID